MRAAERDDALAGGAAQGTEGTNKNGPGNSRSDRGEECAAEALRFVEALCGPTALPEDERVILCSFRGDPGAEDEPGRWRPKSWRPGRALPFDPHGNVYVNVSLVRRDPADDKFNRRVENCVAGLTLMIDDVPTKVEPDFMNAAPPSAIIETSPGNYQVHYFLAEPLRDMVAFDTLARSFLAKHVPRGIDPGMLGVSRVARLPGALNMKPKHGGAFRVSTVLLAPERRWTPADLIRALGIDRLVIDRPRDVVPVADDEAALRRDEFEWAAEWLGGQGLLMRPGRRPGRRWTNVRCPWEGDHSDGGRTGAAIGEPNAANGWYGAFQCHHGHCADRRWVDFIRWVEAARGESYADRLARVLAWRNAQAAEDLP